MSKESTSNIHSLSLSITLLPLLFSLRTQNSPLIYPLTLSQPLITQNIPISNLFETVQIIPQTLPSFVNFGRLMHFTTALTFANLKIILNILELIHRTQSHVKCHSYPSPLILLYSNRYHLLHTTLMVRRNREWAPTPISPKLFGCLLWYTIYSETIFASSLEMDIEFLMQKKKVK